MPKAEFGIIDKININKVYEKYEPKKYQCISINADYIDDWWEQLITLKSYFHCMDRPEYALAPWGITLIPTESLETYYKIVVSDIRANEDSDLIKLIELIDRARKENKFIIHFGV